MTLDIDIAKVRRSFPSLFGGYLYAENGGGSQASGETIERMFNFLVFTNVQVAAPYSLSVAATERVGTEAREAARQLFNADTMDQIVWAMSTTLNLENLATGLQHDIKAGDEFILTHEHDANLSCWRELAIRTQAVVKYWVPKPARAENPYSVVYDTADLINLVTAKTRIFAFTPASNILGYTLPIKDIVAQVRTKAKQVGAPKVDVVVDVVAWIPHRQVDVKDWDVDFAVFSYYKVYGPHVSPLYTRDTSVQAYMPLYFISDTIKIQHAGPGYESVYASTGSLAYLLSVSPTNKLTDTYDLIKNYDPQLSKPILDFLLATPQWTRGVRVVGKEGGVGVDRLPTICFIVSNSTKPLTSTAIVDAFVKEGSIGMNHGAFGTPDLLRQLGIDTTDGVVRISLVHYNTVGEVQKLLNILTKVLAT